MWRRVFVIVGSTVALLAAEVSLQDQRTAFAADPLARAAGTDFRVVVWNVYGFPERSPEPTRRRVFGRLLRALGADILLLNECNGSERDVVDALAAGDPGSWAAAVNGELVVAARAGRAVTTAFDRPLLPEASDLFLKLFERLFGRARATAFGAVVADRYRRLLVVPVHLPCCGDEAGRRREAPVVRDVVQRALVETRADAVIVAGDFNTVSGREPLDVVRRGAGISGTPLAVLDALQLDGHSTATWDGGPSSRYPPGRLDWLLYSAERLSARRAFVFEAADLAAHWLNHYALEAPDSRLRYSSDHLPIVVDFMWR